MSQKILKKAEEFCAAHKHRLTPPRAAVLRIITTSKKPLGAYEILERLGQTINNPKPPTAYRAIDFWQEHGFIHRIESLNAYVICEAGHQHAGSQFMICDDCGNVTEAHLCNLPNDFKKTVESNGFIAKSWNMELHGTCATCLKNN